MDAIKHQAKTVTVGISRSDETLLQVPLAMAVMAAGAPRDSLSYRTLRTLADLDPAVEEVTGWIRYRIEGDPTTDDEVFASVIDRGGIAAEIPSRIERDPVLRGTKHTVAIERELLVFRGTERRPHADRHPGDEGQPLHGHHAVARPLRGSAAGRDMPRRVAGLPKPVRGVEGRSHRDRAELPRGSAR